MFRGPYRIMVLHSKYSASIGVRAQFEPQTQGKQESQTGSDAGGGGVGP